MKLINMNYISETRKKDIKMIVGVLGKTPKVIARKKPNGYWDIYYNISCKLNIARENFLKLASVHKFENVLSFIYENNMVAYTERNGETNINNQTRQDSLNSEQNYPELNRRRTYRKEVHLNGFYIKKNNEIGDMIVQNISLGGMRFTTLKEHALQIEDILNVEFELDNKSKSKVSRKLVVRNLYSQYIGGEFINKPSMDGDLGFYLMG